MENNTSRLTFNFALNFLNDWLTYFLQLIEEMSVVNRTAYFFLIT